MKEIIVNNNTYLFEEVPNNAYDFCLHKNFISANKEKDLELVVDWFSNTYPNYNFEKDFKIISTTKDITEEQARSIIENVTLEDVRNERRNGTGQILHYFENYLDEQIPKTTAKKSLQTLIQANGLDLTKNYLILKKL